MYRWVLCVAEVLTPLMIHPRWCSLEKAISGFRCEEFSIPRAPIIRLRMMIVYVNEKVFCVTMRVLVKSRRGASFCAVDNTRIEIQLIWGIVVIYHCWNGAAAVFTRTPVVMRRSLENW